MLAAKAFRSWLGSVLTCVAALAVWIAAAHIISGRTQYLLHNMIDVSIAFGSVFAIVAAVLYVPAFGLLTAILKRPLGRMTAVAVGALLAPAAYLAVAMTFRESEDPQTISAWLAYAARNLPGLAIGVLPFVTGGAVFGLLWSAEPRR